VWETPFVLVFDEVAEDQRPQLDALSDRIRDRLGARGSLAFLDRVELPEVDAD
jgi:hypothetical protein